MDYNYKDDTLLHSVGFNLQRFESILKYGIVSKNYASKDGIDYAKNYAINNQNNDYISLVRVGDINLDNYETSYWIHTKIGINFIVEDVNYVSDRKELFIHRIDEVLVKDNISIDKIKGIAIPLEYQNKILNDDSFGIIPLDVTTYKFVYDITVNYLSFLKSHYPKLKLDNILFELKTVYFNEIYYTNNAIKMLEENAKRTFDNSKILEYVAEKNELMQNYREILKDLNEFLNSLTYTVFSKILDKEPTLIDVINYLSNNQFMIYQIPYDYQKEHKRA